MGSRAKFTKKIRRAISNEESIRNYFEALRREHNKAQSQRWRLAQVVLRDKTGDRLLMVRDILEHPNGVVVVVSG